ncbi:MAG TPA: hypothetical protein VIM65_02345 [Cyclobacteriaceae bacterium]
MKEFYFDKTAKIYYDSDLDTLFLEYLNKVSSDDQFININTALLNAFRSLQTHKFIADIRKMGIISIEAQNWVVNNLLPGMIKHLAGKTLFHAQLLDSAEILSKVSANQVKNKAAKTKEKIEVMQFTNREEMIEFLKKIK